MAVIMMNLTACQWTKCVCRWNFELLG